jgi:hypothetical protein
VAAAANDFLGELGQCGEGRNLLSLVCEAFTIGFWMDVADGEPN